MNDRKRIKLRRGGHESTDAVTAEFVRRAITEALEVQGLADFREWKTDLEGQMQILRLIANDMRTAVALSYTHAGSARVKLNELLEGFMSALANVDQLLRPGDIGELSTEQQLLNRAFEGFRQPVDTENEAVETDDFEDPLEAIFDDVDNDEPTRSRRRRTRRR